MRQGDSIKKGQHVGYVEQLGTFVPIESKQAGEIVQFVVEDGKPVEYGEVRSRAVSAAGRCGGQHQQLATAHSDACSFSPQVVVELAPFFGGHIIGEPLCSLLKHDPAADAVCCCTTLSVCHVHIQTIMHASTAW